MPSVPVPIPNAPVPVCPVPVSSARSGPMEGFLIPSVFGDEPQLADLRGRIADALRLDVVALPDAGAPGALLTDMAATARGVADEVVRRQPSGPLALVGFSFGASVALEAAVQLTRAGRRIAFLGILDGPFTPPETPRHGAEAPVMAATKGLARAAAVDAAGAMHGMRRLVLAATPAERAEPMRRALLWHLRNKALLRWTPEGCDAPGLHVSTGDYGAANRARWAALCPRLVPVVVPAVHQHLLKGEALEAVVAALAQAVRSAKAGEASA